MQREEALALLKKHLNTKNLLKHTYAVEAVMRDLAEHLDEDADRWALAGLLHDIDYDETGDDPSLHSIRGADMLAEAGLDEELVDAVRAHNDFHGLPRETKMAQALYAVDPLTGLIVAAALVHPDRSLAALDVEFVMNRYGEKSFARGARRDVIASCEELGMELEEFVGIALQSMQRIREDLGL
ncbi:MAG: HDIG domain-containing protein [Bacillota bacterium]